MAQFIHLSLLLATIQLPLVSVTQIQLREGTTVTFKVFHPCKSIHCCRGVECGTSGSQISNHTRIKVNQCDLTIYSLRSIDSGIYHCRHEPDHRTWTLNLTVITGFINKYLNDLDFSKNQPWGKHMSTPDDCRRLCTADWYPSSGVCNENDDAVGLQFHPQTKSWFEALKYCREKHFSLVQITNSTMQLKVKSLLQNRSSSIQAGVWIGLERSMFGMSTIPWKWISGSKVGQPGQWNSSFPVDSLNNHCGKIIRVNETDFKWLDGWCHDELPFICQGSVSADAA